MTDTRLDPQIRSILEQAEAAGDPPLESLSPVEARQAAIDGLGPWKGEPEPVANVEDRTIPGPAGAIPIRIYTPEAPAPRPALVYFHGGGWVVCDLDTHDVVCRAIARRSGAVVVAVDYRLAPEHKFPAAVDDCYTATRWVAENAAALGVHPQRIAVGGDSAGGNLAAAVSQRAARGGGPAIAAQALVYPATDFSTVRPSLEANGEGYLLTADSVRWFSAQYLGDHDPADPHGQG